MPLDIPEMGYTRAVACRTPPVAAYIRPAAAGRRRPRGRSADVATVRARADGDGVQTDLPPPASSSVHRTCCSATTTRQLHLVLNSVDACVALLVAYLLLGAFRRRRHLRDDLLAQGFLLLALAGLVGMALSCSARPPATPGPSARRLPLRTAHPRRLPGDDRGVGRPPGHDASRQLVAPAHHSHGPPGRRDAARARPPAGCAEPERHRPRRTGRSSTATRSCSPPRAVLGTVLLRGVGRLHPAGAAPERASSHAGWARPAHSPASLG